MPRYLNAARSIRRTNCFSAVSGIAAALSCLAAAPSAHADLVGFQVKGAVDFIQEDEYGTAGPLPPGAVPVLPFFSGATQIVASIAYDPATATDRDPSPQAGQYTAPGTFSLSLPDVGMLFTATGNLSMSAYTAGEFHVNGHVTGHVGNLGSATPFAISFVFYGPRASDGLPLGPGNWTYGNAYVDLQDIEPYRNIFIGVAPVPEPSSTVMLLSAMVAGFAWRRLGPAPRR